MFDRFENSNRQSRRTFLNYIAGTAGMLSLPLGSAFSAPPRNIRRTGASVLHGVAREYEPRTDEEREVVKRVADRVKHAFAVAATQPLDARFPAGGYAAIAQKFLRRQSSARLATAQRTASAMLGASLSQRRAEFGEAADKGVAFHRGRLAPDPVISTQLLKAAREGLRNQEDLKQADGVPTGTSGSGGRPKLPKLGAGYKKLGFRINSVKCVEETDEVGADEIMLGGIATSPVGQVIDIPKWKVSNDFDKGESVVYYLPFQSNYNPADPAKGRNLAEFDLWTPGEYSFPGTWTISLLMGEEDQGGFGDILAELWEAIKDDLLTLVSDEIGEAIGGIVGGIIALLAIAVLGVLIGWLVALFDNPDDVVGIRTWELTLLNPFKAYFNTLTQSSLTTPSDVWAAPQGVLNFVGDGGRYDVKLHWRVYG